MVHNNQRNKNMMTTADILNKKNQLQ